MSDTTAPVTGLLTEARALAGAREWSALASRLGQVPEPELYAEPEAAFLLADALWRVGEPARAAPLAERVRAVAGQRGDTRLGLRALNVLGILAYNRGDLPRAEEYFGELLERATGQGDEVFVARAANNLGVLDAIRGRRHLALTSYQRAMAGYTREGNQRGLAQTHHNLGLTFRDLGLDADADAHFQRAIELATAAQSEDVVAMAETERAMLRARAGDGKLAESMGRRALERSERLGDAVGIAYATRVLAAAARALGDDAAAGRHLDAALALAAADGQEDPLLRADVQRDRGLLLRDLGRLDEAREALLDAVASFDRLGAAAEAEALRAILAGLPDASS